MCCRGGIGSCCWMEKADAPTLRENRNNENRIVINEEVVESYVQGYKTIALPTAIEGLLVKISMMETCFSYRRGALHVMPRR